MTTTEFGSLGEPIEQTQIRVRKAARCLPRRGLGHAYGHISARLDDSSFLVCAAKPMGLIEVGEAGTGEIYPRTARGEVLAWTRERLEALIGSFFRRYEIRSGLSGAERREMLRTMLLTRELDRWRASIDGRSGLRNPAAKR